MRLCCCRPGTADPAPASAADADATSPAPARKYPSDPADGRCIAGGGDSGDGIGASRADSDEVRPPAPLPPGLPMPGSHTGLPG